MSGGSGQLCLKWNNHSNAFNKLLKQIFLEDCNGYSDATILCHGKFYPVHRFVLSTCSEYFEEMFQQCVRLNNKHPFIIVKDIQPEQMEALLNYMYKGEVNVPQEHLPELIKAAEAFKIKGLAVPDEDEPPSKKKRNASSSSPSPVPKRSKNKEHYEPKRTKIENENNPESSEDSNFIAESYCEPLISEIKSEPLENVSEETPVVENTNVEANLDISITKEEELFSTCKAFDFDNSDQFQEQQESESQWNEEFHSFDEGEGSQEDPSNRSLESYPPLAFQQEDDGLSENSTATNESFAGCSYTAGNYELEKHNSSHNEEKLFKCDLCSYESSRNAHLIQHRRIHTGEKPYSCTHCPFKSSQKNSLTQHIRIHTGEKPFKCNQCSYKASTKPNLNRHVRTHTGEKPYSCMYCPYKATRKSILIQHLRRHTCEA